MGYIMRQNLAGNAEEKKLELETTLSAEYYRSEENFTATDFRVFQLLSFFVISAWSWTRRTVYQIY